MSLAEMYIQGVSTRKVSSILEEMCGFEVSSQDVSRASKLLDEEFIKWRTRPLGRYEYLTHLTQQPLINFIAMLKQGKHLKTGVCHMSYMKIVVTLENNP